MEDQENTVLLVDDEPNVIQGLIRHLRSEPYRILSASSGMEALKILAKEKVDVVITDENMAGMYGAELVSRIRKAYPQIVCMMLSGQANFETAIRAINEGEIYRFLKKPCDPLDLLTDIRLALEQRELVIQSRKLLDQYQKNFSFVKRMKKEHPQLFEVQYDQEGRLIIGDDDLSLDSRKKTVADIKKEISK